MKIPRQNFPLSELSQFAKALLVAYPRGAIVGLSGELGSGKTTLVRHCIAILAQEKGRKVPRVASPTFVIHQNYPDLIPPVDHLDLYRLDNVSELALTDIGYFDILEKRREAGGWVFVEWPENMRDQTLLELDFCIVITIDGETRTYTTSVKMPNS